MQKLGNVFILGDSYSTFEGYIPEGFDPYYTKAGREDNDITEVNQTWWHQLMAETGANLVLNSSFSGTPICNTGYDAVDCHTVSFIGRLDKLIGDRFFVENKIDTFFIFGGTNDSWANSPIGELKYSDWTKEDLFSALPALGYLLETIKNNIDSKVYFILNNDLKPEIENGVKTACVKYGIDVIALHDVEKSEGHPTILGMKQIKDQILAAL